MIPSISGKHQQIFFFLLNLFVRVTDVEADSAGTTATVIDFFQDTFNTCDRVEKCLMV